jgi:predicted amidohydrolase YtcJ
MDDLERCAVDAARRGFRIAVHAIGNAGVDAAIATFTEVRATTGDTLDHRFRLEHAGVTSPDQWRRLAALDAVAVVQPGFVEHVGIQSQGVRFDDHHWLAFAGLAGAGVRLAGSSDDPCAPAAPVWGALLGASRTTSTGIGFEPEQAVALDDWLFAYTAGAAYAGGQEHERGRIMPGLRADFVVLDLEQPTPVVGETWIGGRLVHDAGRG